MVACSQKKKESLVPCIVGLKDMHLVIRTAEERHDRKPDSDHSTCKVGKKAAAPD